MNLEAASDISGIIGGVGTIIGLYFAWNAQRLKRDGGGPSTPAIPEEKKGEIINAMPTSTADYQLRSGLAAAKKIHTSAERDVALSALARNAISTSDWRLAIEVAEAMFYKSGKDNVLGEIVEAAIKQKEWRVADAASDLMYYLSSKDSAKRRIATAVTK